MGPQEPKHSDWLVFGSILFIIFDFFNALPIQLLIVQLAKLTSKWNSLIPIL